MRSSVRGRWRSCAAADEPDGRGEQDVITADGQADHDGIDHITAGKQHSRPAAMVHHDCRDTAGLPVAPAAAGACA